MVVRDVRPCRDLLRPLVTELGQTARDRTERYLSVTVFLLGAQFR
jgi:hypothetical protein